MSLGAGPGPVNELLAANRRDHHVRERGCREAADHHQRGQRQGLEGIDDLYKACALDRRCSWQGR